MDVVSRENFPVFTALPFLELDGSRLAVQGPLQIKDLEQICRERNVDNPPEADTFELWDENNQRIIF